MAIFILTILVFQAALRVYFSMRNRQYVLDAARQSFARETLSISDADWQKTVTYYFTSWRFGITEHIVSTVITLLFLFSGAVGQIQAWVDLEFELSTFWKAALLMGILAFLSWLLSLPFALYKTFVIEEKFGFNKQTPVVFIMDQVKATLLMAVLGLPLFWGLHQIVATQESMWWFYGWALVTVFSLLMTVLFPTVIAPLFNKFKPLDAGDLKTALEGLAQKTNFPLKEISIMDGSKRSTHANAYVTGMFGQKKIVLFDTLVDTLKPDEVEAVLAHELGHFKLKHVAKSISISLLISLAVFYLAYQFAYARDLHATFHLNPEAPVSVLIVFFITFGVIQFFLTPFGSALSQKHEFEADAFAAKTVGTSATLKQALVKLRERSFSMPLRDPFVSRWNDSHPPLLDRIKKLGA